MNPVLTAYHSLPSTDLNWKASIHSQRRAVWVACDSTQGRAFQDKFVKGINR